MIILGVLALDPFHSDQGVGLGIEWGLHRLTISLLKPARLGVVLATDLGVGFPSGYQYMRWFQVGVGVPSSWPWQYFESVVDTTL